MAGTTTPGSWKALRDAASDLRKVICYRLGRKPGVVDRWVLPPPVDAATRNENGMPNPLDHVIAIYEIIRSDDPRAARKLLDWVCRQCGGRFVVPPPGQTVLMADPDEAHEGFVALRKELEKGDKARPEVVRDARRRIQNFIDLAAPEDPE